MKFITVLVLCTVAIACVSAQSGSAEPSKGVAVVWDQMQTMISEALAQIIALWAQFELFIGGLKLTEMLSGTLSAAKNSGFGQGITGLRSRFSASGET